MNAVEFQHVTKSFSIYTRPADRLLHLLGGADKGRPFTAVSDLTFSIPKGSTFCIIGENGAGKSTVLQIMAGIMAPSTGTATVSGRVAALLELGSGFNPEFTGRENIYLNASVLGLTRAEIDAKFEAIENFAEIGDFLDQPVKTYSSGMAIRLGFAIAIHVEPTILLVDEALAVGDIYFRQRCLRRIQQLRSNDVTVVFVSHSMSDVAAIGDCCLWLERGKTRKLGPPGAVVAAYIEAMATKESIFTGEATTGNPAFPQTYIDSSPPHDGRSGDGRALITGIAIMDTAGHVMQMLEPANQATVRISIYAIESISHPSVGFIIRNHLGIEIAETSTATDGHPLQPWQAGERLSIDFAVEIPELYPAFFSFTPLITDGAAEVVCDRLENAVTLPMGRGEGLIYGYLHWPNRIEVNKRLNKVVPS